MLRFGLLGTGYWAAETHAAGLSGHPDAEFVGVWGRNRDKALALAERFRIRAYADVDELITDVDAVAVALPPDVQAGLAVRAARAGRHLLLDKPVALSVEAADEVVEALAAGGGSSLVFTTSRYRPEVDAFLTGVVRTGGWYGAEVTMYGATFEAGSPYADSAWRREHGGLWDLGPHALSLVVPVLGPVAEVSAVTGPQHTYHVLLRHTTGPTGPVSTLHLGIHFSAALARWHTVFSGAAGWATVPDGIDALAAFRVAVSRLAANVAAGVTVDPLDVRAGRDAVAVLVAAQTAAVQGRTVRL
jgi:predicted dehydrogenase